MADWRLDSCGHLRGLRLQYRQWVQSSADWDHDHCAACWSKFASSGAPDLLHEGFTTCDDYKHGANYEWVCEQCFHELKDEMGWRTELN